jgi:hypothetical protein
MAALQKLVRCAHLPSAAPRTRSPRATALHCLFSSLPVARRPLLAWRLAPTTTDCLHDRPVPAPLSGRPESRAVSCRPKPPELEGTAPTLEVRYPIG